MLTSPIAADRELYRWQLDALVSWLRCGRRGVIEAVTGSGKTDVAIAAASDALRAGVPLTGYYVWSLLDNYEWSLGYTRRFGLVHVDFASQRRTPKDSARWYQRLIASQ